MVDFYHAPALIDPQEGQPRVFLATPAINIYGNHFAAMVQAVPMLMVAGVSAEHYLLMGHCHIDDARNICVAVFLQSEAEALIFIDADVGFPPEALVRMARHKGEVVAGVYPRKDAAHSWPVKFEPDATPEEGPDGVIRNGVAGLPTGFMKIDRRVLEGMADVDKRRFKAPLAGNEDLMCPIIFERNFGGGERMSGDYAFCQKAKALGFELAVDPHIPFTHEGNWRFGGRLYDEWKKAPKEEPTQ